MVRFRFLLLEYKTTITNHRSKIVTSTSTYTHRRTHTDAHRHTQTHTDTHRHTQTHTDTQEIFKEVDGQFRIENFAKLVLLDVVAVAVVAVVAVDAAVVAVVAAVVAVVVAVGKAVEGGGWAAAGAGRSAGPASRATKRATNPRTGTQNIETFNAESVAEERIAESDRNRSQV